jgi:beta-glucosidase
MLIDDILEPSAAFIAAWLPGTSGGQGILNAITGDYLIQAKWNISRINTLSVDWPRGMVNINNYS